MVKRPQLTMTVAPDGTVKSDFLHFAGPACLDVGRQLHALLAELGIEIEVTGFTPKPELAGASVQLGQTQAEAQVLQEGGQ